MTIQKFVHKPEEIVALRFYNNNKEIEEFLEENNEGCCMDYEWRFCVHNNEPLLEIRKPLPECGVYQIIDVPRGDYISTDENGVIIHIYEEDIKEFYDEVNSDAGETEYVTFNGCSTYITNLLDNINHVCGYDKYEYYYYTPPRSVMEIFNTVTGETIKLIKGDTLAVDEEGTLTKIHKEENEHE